MMYVMSAAFDPATKSVYTVTVPNNKVKRLVVSRFDRRDMTLSEEFSPTLAADSGLALAGKRTLDEFVVTGATIADGKMYAISAAYSTLLTIDLGSHTVVAAHAVPGLVKPTGLAVKGEELYIVREDGGVSVVGATVGWQRGLSCHAASCAGCQRHRRYSSRSAVTIGSRIARMAGKRPPSRPSTSAHPTPSTSSAGVTRNANPMLLMFCQFIVAAW